MPERQPPPNKEPVRRAIERDIVYALTPWQGERAPVSLDDLADELEEPDVSEAVDVLDQVGLIHRTADGLVYASPAALFWIELIGHVV